MITLLLPLRAGTETGKHVWEGGGECWPLLTAVREEEKKKEK